MIIPTYHSVNSAEIGKQTDSMKFEQTLGWYLLKGDYYKV